MNLEYFQPQFPDEQWPVELFSVGFDVNAETTALLIIDMQGLYVDSSGNFRKALEKLNPRMAVLFAERLERQVMPANLRLIRAFRDAGRQIVYTKHASFIPDRRDLILRRRIRDEIAVAKTGFPHMEPSEAPDIEIVEALRPLSGDYVVEKNSSSPFNSTGIDQVLRNMGIETLVITGLATEMCVMTTSCDAADRGYNVIVVEDACTTYDLASHESSLLNFSRTYGKVMKSHDVLQILNLRADQSS